MYFAILIKSFMQKHTHIHVALYVISLTLILIKKQHLLVYNLCIAL